VALQGTLDTFALADLVRLLATTSKTGELVIDGDRGTGRLWFADGILVGGEPRGEGGSVDALFALLRFEEGGFRFEADVAAPEGSGVPGDAVAALLNVTAVRPDAAGHVTVFPCGEPVPNASNLNYSSGAVVPNAVLAKVGSGGRVCLYTHAASDLIVDVAGFQRGG